MEFKATAKLWHGPMCRGMEEAGLSAKQLAELAEASYSHIIGLRNLRVGMTPTLLRVLKRTMGGHSPPTPL